MVLRGRPIVSALCYVFNDLFWGAKRDEKERTTSGVLKSSDIMAERVVTCRKKVSIMAVLANNRAAILCQINRRLCLIMITLWAFKHRNLDFDCFLSGCCGLKSLFRKFRSSLGGSKCMAVHFMLLFVHAMSLAGWKGFSMFPDRASCTYQLHLLLKLAWCCGWKNIKCISYHNTSKMNTI